MTPTPRKARPKKARVLVVDDSPEMRRLLMTTLRLEGYRSWEAASGEECLVMAREAEPDLLVVDVMMPGMDGFELLRRLRADPHLAHAKIVMLTAHAGSANVARSHSLGADAFLLKPIATEQLMDVIRSLVG